MSEAPALEERLAGVLLGTALGDAFGLPMEGMSASAIRRRFGRPDRFHLFGRTGFVSDDTEQAALVAQSLAREPHDPVRCALAFRRSLLGWALRLPWGIGRATLHACLRMMLGLPRSGVRSAGNGAAMRAAVVGVYFRDDQEARERFGRALAEVTHVDPRAVDGALYVAEVAAAGAGLEPTTSPLECVRIGIGVLADSDLRAAAERAVRLAEANVETEAAAAALGTSGYVLHTAAFATFCFVRFGDDPIHALREAISAGGDTDSIAAVLGGWLGALHGATGLPQRPIARIHNGPFGPSHLRALAACLAERCRGGTAAVPGYSMLAALLRNLALYPVVLAHGFRRLLPYE